MEPTNKSSGGAADAQAGGVALVPGRDCGTCVVCCYATHVDTPEFKKAQGVVCSNCTGCGCGIYEARPPICREFHCGWRTAAELSDDWRPDRSGVLLVPRWDHIPEGYSSPHGWTIQLLAGEIAISRNGFVDLVIQLVERRVPAFLTACGPMGFPSKTLFINELLVDAVKKRDRAAVFAVLVASHRELMNFPSMAEAREARVADAGSPVVNVQTPSVIPAK